MASWDAVTTAGWVQADDDFDDGDSLCGRRLFVLDEGFGTVVKHKAKKRGGGMTTIDFGADGKKTLMLSLAGNRMGGTAWMSRAAAHYPPEEEEPAEEPTVELAPAPAPARHEAEDDDPYAGMDMFAKMAAKAKERERELAQQSGYSTDCERATAFLSLPFAAFPRLFSLPFVR